jgi:hypothetical protein
MVLGVADPVSMLAAVCVLVAANPGLVAPRGAPAGPWVPWTVTTNAAAAAASAPANRTRRTRAPRVAVRSVVREVDVIWSLMVSPRNRQLSMCLS